MNNKTYEKEYNCKLKILTLLVVLLSSCPTFAQISHKLWQPYSVTPRALPVQHIDLSGTWELSYMDRPIRSMSELKDKKDPFETQVPNSIQCSYYKAGKLPHPYVHKNSDLYNWMDEKAWYYQKEFLIPLTGKDKSIILSFDGIDYFSKVWVNDSLIGEHEGMFGGPVIDLSRFVNFGSKNKIIVEVKAANWGNKQGYNPLACGRIIKPWNISGGVGTEAFFSVGMWQTSRIDILPDVHLDRPYITTISVTPEEAQLHLSVELLANITSLDKKLHPWNNSQINHPSANGTTFIEINENLNVLIEFLSEKQVVFSKVVSPVIYKGTNWLEEDLLLPEPKLWNPNGLGNPNLYQIKITLQKNGNPIDQVSFDYGIRTIKRVASKGPRTADRWENWQFIVNGRQLFVKGINWMPADILLDLSEERYRWALEAAKNMGVQLIRVWGGGLLETDYFYNLCDELGIMVWQDFPIGNQDTPDFPQDIWEAQVIQNIFRLRNHPSLAVWCGGNEFNPYSLGNTASIGIIERNLDIFDKSRLFVRTTPDDGSIHTYPDMDPCWYNRSYKFEPWVSETGMHSMPEANLFYELVDNKEFVDLGKMWDKDFYKIHPEFIHHFTEYGPARVPRMLSRASHIDDMSDPTIESITEATQIGAGEFYQVLSEKIQGNYPVTTGLMPWVFKRPWPVIAIQTMDWFGQAAAPYYFLKRTYEPTHAAIDLQRLLWAPEDQIDLVSKITHANKNSFSGTTNVTIYDDKFHPVWKNEKSVFIKEGPSVNQSNIGAYQIPPAYTDRYLFIVTELKNNAGGLISRSVYYPRVLEQMEDKEFKDKYISEPIAWIALQKGPWLKPTVSKSKTKLSINLISNSVLSEKENQILVKVKNDGNIPAFMTKVDIEGAKRIFYATDNYFWLSPGEEKEVKLNVQWREPQNKSLVVLAVQAWNTKKQTIKLD